MKNLIFLALIVGVGIYYYSASFFVTLFVISFLIFFHELGHFLAAKSLKIKVEIFSIGFGKALFEKEMKGTRYRLSALPLGGYVKLKGQDDLNPSLENHEKDSYTCLKPLQKIYILFAGPFFNIFLAFLLYIFLGFLGTSKYAPIIGSIAPNSAASKADLRIKDEILKLNNIQITSFDELSKNLKDTENSLVIKRGEKIFELKITPKMSEAYNDFMQKIQKPVIGIAPSGDTITIYHKGFDSLKYAFEESVNASMLIVKGLFKLISGDIAAKNLGGILTMVDITSKASQSSLSLLLIITALISINLGILNLLPIPMLDGGHIVFNLYELCFQRKVPKKAFEYLSYAGLALLLSLMIYATFNDIARFTGLY